MRKMKRLIALITVAMFVLSFAAPAMAAATASDSFYKLKGLGVAYGDQNGNPMLEKTYTRAEAAALMVQLSGMKDAVSAAKGATKFKDVPASHWASGVINLAVGNGIIKGYPNGTYAPDKPVTYAEMSAMLVQVLGYAPKLQGSWPNNVIGKAAELGLLDGLKVTNYSDAAVRGQVFVACNNALDVNMLEEDADGQGYTKVGKLIDEKFDSAIYDEVDATVYGWSVDTDGQFVLDVTGDDPTTETVETNHSFELTLAKDAVVEGGVSPSQIVNQKINFVYNSKDDEAAFIDLVSTKVATDDVKEDGTNKLKVNGTSYKYATGFNYTFASEAANVKSDFYWIYLDSDNRIYDIVKNPATATTSVDGVDAGYGDYGVGMIDKVNSDKTIDLMDSGNIDLDVDTAMIIKDGKVATINDLKSTDLVYYVDEDHGTLPNGVDAYVEAYSTTLSGKFEGVTGSISNQFIIAGKTLDTTGFNANNVKISTDNGDNWDATTDDIADETVTYALDASGDVAFVTTGAKSDSNVIYGVVDDMDWTTKDVVDSVTLMTSAGTLVTYPVNTSEVDLTYTGSTKAADPDYTVIDDASKGAAASIVKVTLDSNGKINDLTKENPTDDITNANKDLNKLYINGKWYYTNAETKVIDGEATDDASVVNTSDFLDKAESVAFNNVFVKLDGSKVKFVLMSDSGQTFNASDKALVVRSYASGSKDYVVVDIRGVQSTYQLANGAYSDYTADDLYDYSMSGTKIDLDAASEVDFSTTATVYGEITDVDADSKSVELSDGVANISVDADTYIYDMTGDDAVYVKDFSKLSTGKNVFVMPVDPAVDADREGVADWIFIVDDADYPTKAFNTGYNVSPF